MALNYDPYADLGIPLRVYCQLKVSTILLYCFPFEQTLDWFGRGEILIIFDALLVFFGENRIILSSCESLGKNASVLIVVD